MEYFEQSLGKTAVFLLPSLKLKERRAAGNSVEAGTSVEEEVHRFLLDNFGGYTAAAGNIFGYWKDRNNKESYGEHREFTVALLEDSKLGALKEFLARIAVELDEQSIYLEAGGYSSLIFPAPPSTAPTA